ncbi:MULTISPECIES: hypothetical protein [unclassified Sphingopyxis]|uniref:hypothetical protein n=1 Tax=unclassified Sphingopyxis TaxID=2614943 RepID=UPI000736A122|nr:MULTISPECIES: hypothetical protein [unclassified Sphingopyxis]KTE44230.1 hypothetical protein ATE62_03225 [Sphingopyxis sp. HIX]KTE85880.1 hypothetical protein ATE72_01185 [Sphingopyxis sp. HXXIV]
MTPQDDLPDTGTGEETENEVLRAARELQAQKEAAEATEAADKGAAGGKKIGWKTAAAAAGIGIGSAAVLAALLYANRGKIK